MSCLQALSSSKGTPLKDVVDVTMEVSAGTPGYAATVRDQLATIINGRSYLNVSSQCCLYLYVWQLHTPSACARMSGHSSRLTMRCEVVPCKLHSVTLSSVFFCLAA